VERQPIAPAGDRITRQQRRIGAPVLVRDPFGDQFGAPGIEQPVQDHPHPWSRNAVRRVEYVGGESRHCEYNNACAPIDPARRGSRPAKTDNKAARSQ